MQGKRSKKLKTSKKQSVENRGLFQRFNSDWLCMGGLVLIFLLLYPYIFDKKLDLSGDNASYYILAKSLITGNGYSNICFLGHPPHNHFPPGYPLLLAPFMLISDSISFLKSINGVFFLFSTLMVYKILRLLNVRALISFGITVLFLSNYHLLKASTIMMSEMPVVFSSLVALYCFMKYELDKEPKLKFLIISIVFAVIAIHIKTLAISFLLALLVYFGLFKKWRPLLISLGLSIILMAPFQIRNSIHGLESGYANALTAVNPYRPELGQAGISDYANRFVHNLDRYFSKEIPNGLFTIKEIGPDQKSPLKDYFLGLLALASIFYGWFKLDKLKLFFFLYLGAMFGILLLWPEVWYGIRFMIGVLPVLLLLFYLGIYTFLKEILKKKPGLILSSFLIISSFMFLNQLGLKANTGTNTIRNLNAYAKAPYYPAYQNYFDLAQWASKNIPKDKIIASRKPDMYYMFDNRYTYNYPQTENDADYFKELNTNKINYLVVEQLGFSSTARFLVPMINKHPDKFKLIYKLDNPDTYLFEYIP